MTKPEVIEWCNTYLSEWPCKARPFGWHWGTEPITKEKYLYCGDKRVYEHDCNLTLDDNVKL